MTTCIHGVPLQESCPECLAMVAGIATHHSGAPGKVRTALLAARDWIGYATRKDVQHALEFEGDARDTNGLRLHREKCAIALLVIEAIEEYDRS